LAGQRAAFATEVAPPASSSKEAVLMSDKPRLLVQLDPDRHASVFDAVVAVDAGVDHLLQYEQVRPEDVTGLVHGAMFTRGIPDLQHTAIFIGGSNVEAGEALLEQVRKTFFGPMRVSVMMDANGANTTAAAAVVSAARHLDLANTTALVLAGTGPVGRRAARLLARQGSQVRLASRQLTKSEQACQEIAAQVGGSPRLTAVQTDTPASLSSALEEVQLVIAAGAAGVQLLPRSIRDDARALRVAIDLNAVPPLGIEGIQVMDRAAEQNGVLCYGAIGVGGTKMKVHKAALRQLFTRNDHVLDAEEIFALARE
jgi:hypothetical protein